MLLSSKSKKIAEKFKDLFESILGGYTKPDLIEVELGGAIKNVIALAA